MRGSGQAARIRLAWKPRSLAVKERRELNKAEKAELEHAIERAWANLPPNYQWLNEWEYV